MRCGISDHRALVRAHPVSGTNTGSALVITLIIITLLLFLLMAFFSQSSLQRGSANASASIAAKDIFSSGMVDMIVNDLEQEISDGSNLLNVAATASVTNVLFVPVAKSSMMPGLAGCTGGTGLENLVKRSAAGVPFYSGPWYYQSGITRACSSSTASTSWNGRNISRKRWNRSLLLGRADTNNASDQTPVSSFTPPDWILISRSLSNPVVWDNSLRWSSSNPGTVIGRASYLIFDEGGLLDANVAGYPASPSAAVASSLARKSGAASADLSQIGLTAAQINALTGWRNYVTANAAGSFPSYTFADGGASYVTSILGVTNGFLLNSATNTRGTNSFGFPITDHKFSNRQELISFLVAADPSNASTALNALSLLTSYSRDLNQPSFIPASNRPVIMAMGAGGNDGTGKDDQINPSFLTVCVTTNFVRSDGTLANIGDPLVRKRFPLSFLSWLTYEGPSASASAATQTAYTNAGAPLSVIQQGTTNKILNYFGLTWNASGTNQGSWTYRSGTNAPIKTLSQVASLGRDPDFFELLKAGLVAGSLGKAYNAPGSSNAIPDGYNQARDNSLDAQVMQIGANIIAQSSPDGFCPRIQFNDGSLQGGTAIEYRGVKDLPYLYRVREGKVMTADSSPSMSLLPMKGRTLTNAGSGVVLLEPEIWNPHSQGVLPSNAPTQFQLVATTVNPVTMAPVSYTIGTQWMSQTGSLLSWQSNAATTLNATLSFSIPSGRSDLFREPTLLTTPGIPSGSSLSGPGPFTSLFPAAQYASNGVSSTNFQKFTGIPMGIVPMAFTASLPAGGIASGVPSAASNGIVPSGYSYYPSSGTTGVTSPCVLISLQYLDASNNWVTYDQKYLAAPNSISGYDLPSTGTNTNTQAFQFNVNKTFYRDSNSAWSRNAIGSEVCASSVDPRTSRFGMLRIGSIGDADPGSSFPLGASPSGYAQGICPLYAAGWSAPVGTAVASATMSSAALQNAVLSDRPDECAGMLVGTNSGPTASGWYPAGINARLRPGVLAQNNPNMTITVVDRFTNDPQNPPSYADQFFADADGVVRRGMAANVPYGSGMPALPASGNNPSGLPTFPATSYGSGTGTPVTNGTSANEYMGRPVVLNRPFRSVAELGVVFSGTPWRNLDFTTPESGSAPLLDLFCLNDTSDSRAMVAGKVNLNTRQIPVLRALVSGACKDEFNLQNARVNGTVSTTLANAVASALVARTHSTNYPAGPLQNLSDLTGSWNIAVTTTGGWTNGSVSYCGFSEDAATATTNDLTSVLSSYGTDSEIRIERFREAAIRGLAASGQTRIWNLMIDLIVQTGRYLPQATGLDQFLVEGEQRCWVHVSIDRLTGQLLDKQIEVVQEAP